jgi:hypothetical protein
MRAAASGLRGRRRLVGGRRRAEHSFGDLGADLWRRAFLHHWRREASGVLPGSGRRVVEQATASARQRFDTRRPAVPDRQGLAIVGVGSLIVAAYETLVAEGVEPAVAFEAARRAFLTTFRTPTKLMTRVLLAMSRDPVRSLSEGSFLRRARTVFGTSMGFDQVDADDRVTLVVTGCAFHQFFVEEGQPLLTRIVCEADRSWMDTANASRRPIRMERPRTISTGADCCEFVQVRSSNKADEADDVVLVRRPEVSVALRSIDER